jgi:asparagine N-glycosylation enzyme membrane subunit Stt3
VLLAALGVGVLLLALAARTLGIEWVFVDAHTVVLAPGDAQYHLRRALYGWVAFPEVLFFDRYINFPGGAAISWPPLFDFVLSAVGRVVASDEHAFARMAAWAPPVVGTLALLPVFALGRRLAGPWVGLGAAALLALLPMSVGYSRIGQLDHHCAVAAIGACLLYLVARLADSTRASLALAVALAAGRIAMLLTWHGSLLYLALVEGTLWLTAALARRRDLLGLQAASAAATWIVIAPLVLSFPEPLGGAYSAIALSRLHVLAVVAVAVVSALLWWLEGRSPARTPWIALARTAGLGVLVVAVLLVLPGPRAGLEPAFRFLTMTDGVGFRTGEQLPLFEGFGRATGRPVWEVWGLLGYALPVLPLAVIWAVVAIVPRERRAAGWVVAGWCAWFAALAIGQRRYGNDLGPAAAVGTALVVATIGRRLAAMLGGGSAEGSAVAATAARAARAARVALPVGIALLLLAPPIVTQMWPKARNAFRVWRGASEGDDRALLTVAGTLTRFLEQVRRVTPETAGYFDAALEPEYGIVAQANFGHAIQNVARRATPTDPFWAFIGVENWNASFALLAAENEETAVALAERLRARYVMTFSSADPRSLEGWLHFSDGRASESEADPTWPASGHFRLIAEGPEGGAHFARNFQLDGLRVTGDATLPYKLFEVVKGAELVVPAPAGEEATATVRLGTPTGREVELTARATAGADGLARVRVPYPTRAPVHGVAGVVKALGPYRVHVGTRTWGVAVSEDEVRDGAAVVVPRQADS